MSKSAFYASKESLRHKREEDFLRAQKLEGYLKRLYPICERLLMESLLKGGAPWNRELENILDEIDQAAVV